MPMIGFLTPVSSVNQLSANAPFPSLSDALPVQEPQAGVSYRPERDVNRMRKTTVCDPRSGTPFPP
jgi:hypothetical protein